MTSDPDPLRLLAQLGPRLSAVHDCEEVVDRIGHLAVPELADLCIIDVAEDDATVRRSTAAASRTARPDWATSASPGLAAVWRTKETLLWHTPSAEQIDVLAVDLKNRRLLRSIGIRSLIAAPLLAGGRLLGGIILISSQPARAYGRREAQLAEALADRAALALDNGRLHRAAARAAAARDQVVGLVAHDLRNPLYNILLNAEILSRAVQPGGPPIHPVERIIRSAARMNRLIEDLMDVSQIDHQGLSIARRALRVDQALMDGFDAQRGHAVAASVALRVELPQPIGGICADRARILQALGNLIDNALRFTPVGGEVAVGAGLRGPEVLFWVRDTGPGMEPDVLEHLFDRSWHARRTGRAAAGLGLAIVKGIVEAHGGRIWVDSGPGQGTTVWFTVPIEAPAPASGSRRGGGGRALAAGPA